MGRAAAQELGIAPELVLMSSTGVIGVPLPVEKIENGLRGMRAQLQPDPMVGARGIMTTDSHPKAISTSAGGATIMPRYQEFLEDFARPWKVPEKDWTRSIDGRTTPAEIAEIRRWLGGLPEKEAVQGLKPSERRARAGTMIWDLVHYVRSL